MEYLYLNIDNDEISINKNVFPLKFVILCFMYLILSVTIGKKMNIIKPVTHIKLKKEFNFQENLFPVNKFEIGKNSTYFNITKIDYSFSYDFNIVKVEYYIGFYNQKDRLIVPSDFAFYSDLHLMCNLQIPSINLTIESMANIFKDKYHKCVEFFQINEEVKFGLKIYKMNDDMDYKYFFLFDQQRFNLNNASYRNEDFFNPNLIKENHDELLDDFEDMRINETLKLHKSYEIYPCSTLKRHVLTMENKWDYRNVFNHYFCMCKGDHCLRANVTEKCKYYFYVSIIDSNRDVYKKTEYIFMDFVKADLSSDDTYPVFREMLNMSMGDNAHYITGNLDIYKEHCGDDEYCKKVLLAPKDLKPIYGDFLEKYIFVFFKLKVMISGRPNFNTDLFYNMEYVTYVCVGHGICYFKDYLFNPERIYGIRRNDKIILPDSDILVDIVKKHGWKDQDLFRVNLPRWDKLYEMEQENLIEAEKEEKERIKRNQNNLIQNPIINEQNQINQNNQIQNPVINEQNQNNQIQNPIINQQNQIYPNNQIQNPIINQQNQAIPNNQIPNPIINQPNQVNPNNQIQNPIINQPNQVNPNNQIQNPIINQQNQNNITQQNQINNMNNINLANNQNNLDINKTIQHQNNIETLNQINNQNNNNYEQNNTLSQKNITNQTSENMAQHPKPIQINLTESNENTTEAKRKIKTNSILIMFTWRDLQFKKQISFDYFKNFFNLISNNDLYQELEYHNITVYLSFHRLVKDKYVNKFKNIITEKPLIEFISQQEISECLGRTSLVVTDFSSIIFDLMYRKKPFIIYVPDGNDPTLRSIYKPDYYNLIEAMKNGTISFENKFFSITETIEKIIFYVKNNFALDPKLERFYQTFNFKMEKSIGKFIDYLVHLN